LIGQFGVGFYSGFIVADKITVESRRAGAPAAEGVRWISGGTGDFEVEAIERAERGTSVILHLRDDAHDYLNAWKLKDVINKYSDHISPAHPDAKGRVERQVKKGKGGRWSKPTSGKPSTRPAPCGRVPRKTSPTSNTRVLQGHQPRL
jgi:HSP90 family molecular chaperone